MKRAVAAFLSLWAAIALGILAVATLGISEGRNPWPLLAASAVFLAGAGFTYRRWFFRSWKSCLVGIAAYGIVLGGAVAYEGGTGLPSFFLSWFLALLSLTLIPWFFGFAAGSRLAGR
jgi:hypothetical protein